MTEDYEQVDKLRVFTFRDEENDEEMLVRIPEVIDPAYGMYVWPCAPVLAQYIWRQRQWISGKRVIELGAGTSLPGILAALCGATVTLTDHAQLPRCLANCRKSCQANGLAARVDVVGLTWGEFSPGMFGLPLFDVILASDCFYDTQDFEDVLTTFRFFLERNNNAKCWVTYQERSSDWSIEQLLLKWGLNCLHIPLASFGADGPNIANSNLPSHHTIQLLEITTTNVSHPCLGMEPAQCYDKLPCVIVGGWEHSFVKSGKFI